MLRAIIRSVSCSVAANVGGPVKTSFKTIEFSSSEIEAELAKEGQWNDVECIGIEVVKKEDQKRESASPTPPTQTEM